MLIGKISAALGLPVSYVDKLANSASHAYKEYKIPKSSGGARTIYHPSRPLKGAQRILVQQFISSWPLHPSAMAYRKGVSILDNARLHETSNFLLRMDFSSFFESIQDVDFRRYTEKSPTLFLGWDSADIDLLCKLCFRFGRLTIGAPTSPALANVLCYELDSNLANFCASLGVVYSRYADDLFFSTKAPNLLSQVEAHVTRTVSDLEIPSGLSLNVRKTRHSSKKGARRVTGVVLGSDGKLHIGRALKRRIRAMIHKFSALTDAERATLSGLMSYAVGFDPDFKNSLIAKYGLATVRQASGGGS